MNDIMMCESPNCINFADDGTTFCVECTMDNEIKRITNVFCMACNKVIDRFERQAPNEPVIYTDQCDDCFTFE